MIKDYTSGNQHKIDGQLMTNIYPVGPGVPKPSTGEVYCFNGKIIVADKWTEKIIAEFETEQAFFDSCDAVSGPPLPHNYNGYD